MLWTDANPIPDWRSTVERICPINVNYEKSKAFQYHEFHASYPLKCKFQAAVEKQIIHVRELPAEQFYLDSGPWKYVAYTLDESEELVRRTYDGYEEFINQVDYHKRQNCSPEYLKTLKVLYSYAHRNDVHFEEDIINARILDRPYETFLESEDGTIIFRIYIVNLNDCLYHLNHSRSIKQVVLIPRYKVRSKNNPTINTKVELYLN